ncbi:potassium channel family protein [Haloarcula marismortui]|uniref:Ion transport 2 domain-containing protein n=1 Tax=Haloarcula marismortui ATCC 33799 TaxID=662475 RepID=M0JW59_9EURY|nr:potassium channel family protein [Haloarcula californiae]EMA13216.1 Ion transport 2 domain-containing protein [Haloarcula californiae ATCC 33799]
MEELCAENALLEPQGRYFVRRQDIHTEEHRQEGNWSRWLRARVSRAVVLYGESPFRVLSVAGAVIVGSALLYPLGLLRNSTTGQLMTYPTPTEPVALVTTLADSLYFSTLTFTTMTFGLYSPVGAGKFLTMLETGAGIVLMALLVFVFGRRATR